MGGEKGNIMSNVPKGRQKQSRFEAEHHWFRLRDEVTKLILEDFGFSEEKYLKQIEKFREWHRNDPNCEEQVQRMAMRCEAFRKWYIDEEGRAILQLMRNIEREFTTGNSIYPSDTPARLIEFFTRRQHINRAIGLSYTLKQEIQYAIRTLPVDINKCERFAVAIDEQINLYKGVRQADNRLIRPRKKGRAAQELDDMDKHVEGILDHLTGILRILNRLSERIKQGGF